MHGRNKLRALALVTVASLAFAGGTDGAAAKQAKKAKKQDPVVLAIQTLEVPPGQAVSATATCPVSTRRRTR